MKTTNILLIGIIISFTTANAMHKKQQTPEHDQKIIKSFSGKFLKRVKDAHCDWQKDPSRNNGETANTMELEVLLSKDKKTDN